MGTSMKAYVGVTNNDWFAFLSRQPDVDEVNFWQPSGKTLFRALKPGEPFLFKLHAPDHYIVGGGFFAHSTILPVGLAWEVFGKKNGAGSLLGMRRLIEHIRGQASLHEDYNIGCILLEQPFFFDRPDWIPVPSDFSLNIVRGKTYSLREGQGRRVWEEVQLRLSPPETRPDERFTISEWQQHKRFGDPTITLPRLGQGSFRVMVTDLYHRRCAISQEKVLPALEAAHIKPFSAGGEHKIENGILLRSDIHKLFDAGYVTVTGDHHFEVSRRIHEEFDNGKHYYTFHGKRIHVPLESRFKPSPECLDWHNEHVFRG